MAMAQGTRLRLGLCSFKHPFLWNISPSIASTTTTTAGAIQTCLCLHSNALNPLPQRSPAFHGVRYMQRQLPFQRLFCSEATGDKEKMKKKPVNTKVNFSLSDSEDDQNKSSIEAQKEIEKSKLPPPYDPFNKKPVIEDPDDPKDLQFIFHKMRSEGLINNAVKIFDALSKDGLTHEALELFSQIKDKGHMPDAVAHTAVVEAYANAGQSKEALKVFLRMLACGVAPNAYTYSVLIKALAADGKLADANRYIMEMMSKGMRPNAATYTAVFEAYAKEQKEDQAREFLQQMKERGFVPDEKAVREILNKRGQMANEDSVTMRINEKFTDKFTDKSPVFSDHCIFKVPKQLRSVNEEAYEPQLIAIGPYHHGKDHLLAMEDHKIRYLQSFLQRSAQKNVSRYVQTIRNLEERARKSYAEPLSFEHDEFVEMMLIDGCFIIEFIHKMVEFDVQDPIMGSGHMYVRLMLDLLLLENQLPFFILWELLRTSNVISNPEINFTRLILKAYKHYLSGPGCDMSRVYTSAEMMQIKSILGLVHDNWQPSPERTEVYKKMRETKKPSSTRCATELKEAGIKFKSVEGRNLFHIKFEKGKIEIPKIEITDITECVLRNLLAYEQLTSFTSPKYFTDYIIFMDSLINSKKDVELLCRKGIIDNWKGDDETIAIIFNKLGEHIFCESALYADIVNNVNEHCKKRRNVWMAKLRHNHFQCPWSFISVLTAFILLVLTWIQTVCSVLPYYKKNKC